MLPNLLDKMKARDKMVTSAEQMGAKYVMYGYALVGNGGLLNSRRILALSIPSDRGPHT